MIEFYDFGVMVINGKRYTSDLIVYQEKVFDGWWRREGHRLYVEDLSKVLSFEPKPQVLVVGTGFSGLLKVSKEVEETLKSHEIELVAQPTKEAVQTFNKLLTSGERVAGAFHLTC
ncbi:MAG: Mth938-like domain-containing protein [Candidatus Bathyarchaeia archaeon]|nr:Mth938-like domain-containing protein [Candidatus Bathyarchaeia archaeon]